MFGVTILEGPSDWKVFQHVEGAAEFHLSGSFQIPKAALEVGVKTAIPVVRIVNVSDGYPIIPWVKMDTITNYSDKPSTWSTTLSVPLGGPYHLETALDTTSSVPGISWLFRGDVRLHMGVGNLFVIAGQSNAAGYGSDFADDPPQLGVHMFRNRQEWGIASHPMNESTFAGDIENQETGVSGSSPYLSFAKQFSAYSHAPVGLIPTALGGSSMDQWNSGRENGLFDNMVSRIRLCGGAIAGVLWYQGCSDTDKNSANGFYDKMSRFISETRNALNDAVPFFTFQLNRYLDEGEDDVGWGKVREAQRLLAQRKSKTYILPTLNISLSDTIHNSSSGNILLGEQLARQVAHVLLAAPPFSAPDLLGISAVNFTVQLTFSNIRDTLVLFSNNPSQSGFLIEDGAEEVVILSVAITKPNTIVLTLEKNLSETATISYAHTANPIFTPITDKGSGLSILSFFRHEIDKIAVSSEFDTT